MIVCEPHNLYDSKARRVETLGGINLGYVPKEDTSMFPLEVTPAWVVSVGQASGTTLWGAHFCSQPGVRSVALDPIPEGHVEAQVEEVRA